MKAPFNRRQWLATAGAAALGTAAWPVRAESDDILIGQSCQVTGPFATMGGTLAGQKLAFDEFNARGGVAGRKVKVITLDDAYDPKRTVENVARLIDQEKVTALFGLASTGGVAAVLPMLLEKKVPVFSVYAGSPSLRAKFHPYIFTAMGSYRDEVVRMMKNLKTLLREKVAVVYSNNPFGQSMMPVVEQVAQETGITLVAKSALEVNGSNAVAVGQSLAAQQAQAIIAIVYGPSLVPLVKACRAYVGVPIYGLSVSISKPVFEALGDDARGLAFTVPLPSPWNTTKGLGRDLSLAMKRAKIDTTDYDHMVGYLNARVFLEGLKRTGKNVTSASLAQTFETKMSRVDFGDYVVSYGPHNHHGSSFADIVIIGPRNRFIR